MDSPNHLTIETQDLTKTYQGVTALESLNLSVRQNSFFGLLGKVLPWNLVMDLGPVKPALAMVLAQGLPVPAVTPILGTLGLILVFVAVALWRFARQEF